MESEPKAHPASEGQARLAWAFLTSGPGDLGRTGYFRFDRLVQCA